MSARMPFSIKPLQRVLHCIEQSAKNAVQRTAAAKMLWICRSSLRIA